MQFPGLYRFMCRREQFVASGMFPLRACYYGIRSDKLSAAWNVRQCLIRMVSPFQYQVFVVQSRLHFYQCPSFSSKRVSFIIHDLSTSLASLNSNFIKPHTVQLLHRYSTDGKFDLPTKGSDRRQREIGGLFTVPNILCYFRLAVSPYVGFLIVTSQFHLAFGILLVAGMSDLADGWIARKFESQRSVMGTYIDPLADKVLISIVTLSLTYVSIIPIWLCALFIGRDIGLVCASSWLHFKTIKQPKTLQKFFDFKNAAVRMDPTFISKANTVLQLGLVGLCVAAPLLNILESPFLDMAMYLCGATTVVSGLSYVVKDKSAYIIK